MLRMILSRLGLLGRTSRTTLVNFIIIYVAGSVVAWFILLKRFRDQVHGVLPPLASLPIWLGLVELALGLLWLWLTVRRFHDQDRPGWLALIPFALPAIAWTGAPIPPSLGLLVFLGFLVALFLPGTIGPNRYGPDPRGWKSREHYVEQQTALGRR